VRGFKKSKGFGVKCLRDGELPAGRRLVELRSRPCIPLHTAQKDIFVFFPAYAVRKGDFFMKRQNMKISVFGSIKIMTTSAMLTAISVVIGIFCKTLLNFDGGLFRITFENLPIIMSGIMFGPIVGGLVGAATDIISYLLSPQIYAINIVVTIGATAVGVVSGFFARYIFKKRGYVRLICPSILAHIVGSMIIKPIGLYQFYGVAVLWRIPLYFVIAPLEILVLCLMYRHNSMKRLLDGGFLQ